jgi:hypothetical protein
MTESLPERECSGAFTNFHPSKTARSSGNQRGPAGARPLTWFDGGGGGI